MTVSDLVAPLPEDLRDWERRLTQLKQASEHRLDGIEKELRAIAIKLNLREVGVPGRMGGGPNDPLSELLRRQLELQSQLPELRAQCKLLAEKIGRGETAEAVEPLFEKVTQLYRKQLTAMEAEPKTIKSDEGAQAAARKNRNALLQRKLHDGESALLKALSQMKLDELNASVSRAQEEMGNVTKRIDAIKEDLGGYSNAMNHYASLKQEEKELRERINAIDAELKAINEIR